jgi:hypothetical protein
MCQEMPWLRNPIAAHLVSMFVARNGQCWTERYDTSEERRKHNNRLANRTLRKKKPTRETHIEPAESRGQRGQTGVLSISSQSSKDFLDPQENRTSSMVPSELSRGQEETVPSQLFGSNEERALELENSESFAFYPMSDSHGVDATALILSNSQPSDVLVDEVMLPEQDMSALSRCHCTETQWLGSLDPSLPCSTECSASTIEAMHLESHHSRLPPSALIAQAGVPVVTQMLESYDTFGPLDQRVFPDTAELDEYDSLMNWNPEM